MRIAFLGATSQIAKDLALSFCEQSGHELVLYARRPEAVSQWLASVDLPKRYTVHKFSAFTVTENFDAIFNFVGVEIRAISCTTTQKNVTATRVFTQIV